MNLTTFLQAVISLIFIYLILSLLTSELQEYLATIFEARAKRLKQSIRQMLGEQDYPYYRLKFNGNGSDKLNQGDRIWLKDGKINKISAGQPGADGGRRRCRIRRCDRDRPRPDHRADPGLPQRPRQREDAERGGGRPHR